MKRAAALVAAMLYACTPQTETRQLTLEEELRYFEADKADEAHQRLG